MCSNCATWPGPLTKLDSKSSTRQTLASHNIESSFTSWVCSGTPWFLGPHSLGLPRGVAYRWPQRSAGGKHQTNARRARGKINSSTRHAQAATTSQRSLAQHPPEGRGPQGNRPPDGGGHRWEQTSLDARDESLQRLRLQSLPVRIHARCEGNLSDRQLEAMIGYSLSLNVVGAIVSQLMVACGLLEAGTRN